MNVGQLMEKLAKFDEWLPVFYYTNFAYPVLDVEIKTGELNENEGFWIDEDSEDEGIVLS